MTKKPIVESEDPYAKWFSPSLSAKLVRYGNPVELEKRRKQFAAVQQRGRSFGTYNGVHGKDTKRINKAAKRYAEKTIKLMADKGIITPEDDPRASEALKAALETMRVPANQQTKLAAAKLILEYTKAKPASKSEVTVNKAEEWLAAIASEDDEADAEGNEGDAKAAS